MTNKQHIIWIDPNHEANIATARAKAYKAGDWSNYVQLLTPRSDRLAAFHRIARHLSDAEYWEMLGEVWIDTEAPSQYRRVWLDLFTASRAGREHLMTAEDHAFLNTLPTLFTIFRGALPRFARGMSWTTDLEKAKWFATRFGPGEVLTATVPKRKVLACFLGREEDEIVIDPRRIRYEVLEPERAAA